MTHDRSEVQSEAPRTPFWLWGMALTLGLGGALLVVFLYGGRVYQAGAELPRLGTVPAFMLQERSGATMMQADLLGQVWISSFIYTRCATECPLISSQMARLQDAFSAERDVRLVSITVDPQHDTPEVLARYAQSFAAHPQRWLFLTGDKVAIYRLAREGFRLGVVEPEAPGQSSAVAPLNWFATRLLAPLTPAVALAHHGKHPGTPAGQTVSHSGRLVLVDRQAQIRNYYDSTDMEALRRLQHDVRRVLRES